MPLNLNVITNHCSEIQSQKKGRQITWEDHENNREVTIFWSVVFIIAGAASGYNTVHTLDCDTLCECGGTMIGAITGCAFGVLLGYVDKITQ